MLEPGKGISVIICCYNSATKISSTLVHLSKQKLPKNFLWEVILVDNNSSDNTGEISNKIWGELNIPVPLRVIKEENPGLSNARKKGAIEAKFDLLLFCDDDNWLNEDYLNQSNQLMRGNPLIGALGGRGTPISEIEFPFWFFSFMGNYATGVQALDSGDISSKGWMWGAGMVIRKEILDKIWQKEISNILSDRSGNELSSGGDVEICQWVLISGYKLWYSELLSFSHYIPSDRLTKEYLRKYQIGNKKTIEVLDKYKKISRVKNKKNSKKLLFLISSLFKALLAGLFFNKSGFNFHWINAQYALPTFSFFQDKEIVYIKKIYKTLSPK